MKHVLIQNLTFNLRYGEVVPLGPNYLPSYDEGVRTGLKELCPKLIGQDPTKIKVINEQLIDVVYVAYEAKMNQLWSSENSISNAKIFLWHTIRSIPMGGENCSGLGAP